MYRRMWVEGCSMIGEGFTNLKNFDFQLNDVKWEEPNEENKNNAIATGHTNKNKEHEK